MTKPPSKSSTVGSVLPQLLARLGAVQVGARDGADCQVVDEARADLANALSRALAGLAPRGTDNVTASAFDTMQTMLNEAHRGGPPYAPWFWGAQMLAERGCYGVGDEGFPFSILCERLEPFSARLYVRVTPGPSPPVAVDSGGGGSPRSALQWSCSRCTFRNESDAPLVPCVSCQDLRASNRVMKRVIYAASLQFRWHASSARLSRGWLKQRWHVYPEI